MSANERPTISDFVSGQPYSVVAVARFLGRSVQTVRNMIKDGRLKAVRTNAFSQEAGASSHYLIDGSEIKRFYGADLLEQDRREAPLPKSGDAVKRAAKRMRELEKMDA